MKIRPEVIQLIADHTDITIEMDTDGWSAFEWTLYQIGEWADWLEAEAPVNEANRMELEKTEHTLHTICAAYVCVQDKV